MVMNSPILHLYGQLGWSSLYRRDLWFNFVSCMSHVLFSNTIERFPNPLLTESCAWVINVKSDTETCVNLICSNLTDNVYAVTVFLQKRWLFNLRFLNVCQNPPNKLIPSLSMYSGKAGEFNKPTNFLLKNLIHWLSKDLPGQIPSHSRTQQGIDTRIKLSYNRKDFDNEN